MYSAGKKHDGEISTNEKRATESTSIELLSLKKEKLFTLLVI
jgi:hypothetical protein